MLKLRVTRFRTKVLLSIVPMILGLCVLFGGMSLYQHNQLLRREFIKRGKALASDLAASGELGVFSEDERLLNASLRGITGEEDVAYVFIYTDLGKRLISGGRALAGQDRGAIGDTLDPDIRARVLAERQSAMTTFTAPRGESFLEFYAPILSADVRLIEEQFFGMPAAGREATDDRVRVIGITRVGLALGNIDAHSSYLIRLWIVLTVAILAAATLAAYGLSRRITQPITHLTDLTARMAEGQLDQAIPVTSSDEIGTLAETYNTMAKALKRTLDERERVAAELRDLNRSLEDRIRERTSQLRELHRLGVSMQEPLPLDERLALVLKGVHEVIGFDRVVIWLPDEGRDHFETAAAVGFDPPLTGRLRVPMSEEVPSLARAFRDRAEILVEGDVPTRPELRASAPYDTLAAVHSGHFVAVPLVSRGRSVGVLAADNTISRRPIAPSLDLFRIFAAQAAVAIENAQLFQELQEANRQLKLANRHKSEFLANMSHELRTPLNAIMGFTELIRDEIYGEVPGELQEPVADIHANARHLLKLVNDVLDLAKIEAGRMHLMLSEYSVRELIESVVSATRSLAAEKQLDLTSRVETDLPLGVGDSKRLMQVLMNLIGNGIKFTPPGGSVHISARLVDRRQAAGGPPAVSLGRAADLVEIAVADSGIGIPRDELERIFGEFHQADSSITREYGGSGLGLSIAKRFVELHGGTIWAESEVGKGSTFYLWIPLRAVSEATA
jgi:signal transduction histidine kinase